MQEKEKIRVQLTTQIRVVIVTLALVATAAVIIRDLVSGLIQDKAGDVSAATEAGMDAFRPDTEASTAASGII
jgi:hypothetical protein